MEKNESIKECCTIEYKRSPEEEIRHLKRELRDANYRTNDAVEDFNRKTIQVQSLTDVMLDLRRYTKELENSAKFDAKRMEEYRDAIHEIYCKCEEIISTYEALDPNKDTVARLNHKSGYDLAKSIYEIVRRF